MPRLTNQTSQAYLDALRAEPGVDEVTQRFAYAPGVFNAVSIEVKGSLTSSPDSLRRRMEGLPELKVKNIWPVETVPAPKSPGEVFRLDALTGNARRAASDEPFPPHQMTQVDKLHEKGFSGNGTRVAVIDTGVDWRHPALGGCFGPGCLVEYGYDLVGEDYNGDPSTLAPDDDPWEECNGHGTLVSGVIAAQQNTLGFLGAAPGVKLGVYRTFSCTGDSSTDVMIAAIIRAAEDGSDIINMSAGHHSGWSGSPLSEAMSRVSKTFGIPCVAAAGNHDGGGYGIWSAAAPSSGKGVLSIGSIESSHRPTIGADGVVTYSPFVNGGLVSWFSLWGPTHEGNFKPQFAAPGGEILTTAPGGYTVASGTSFSAPLTAASIALLFEVRGKMSPAEVENLLAITAKPVPSDDGRGLAPVANQGAGIIQVLDAAYATTHITTSGLAFNDTENLVPEREFTITNSGDSSVTYELTHLEAISVEAVWPTGYRRSSPEVIPQVSGLDIEPASITLEAGAEAVVRVKVNPPEGVNATNLPVYGGFVSIKATAGQDVTTLSVPYLGIAGVMRKAHVFAIPRQFYFWREDDIRREILPVGVVFQVPVPAAHPEWARPVVSDNEKYVPAGIRPSWSHWAKIGTRELRYELFSVAPSCNAPKPVLYENINGDETLGNVAGFPRFYQDAKGDGFSWSGRLADGSYAPPGRYGMRVYGLRHFGDRNNKEDWSVLEYERRFGLSYVDM